MAEKNVLFRTSIGGYNRSDVHAYISKTDAEHRTAVEELEERLGDKDKELEALRAELEELKESNCEAEKLGNELEERNKLLDDCVYKLKDSENLISAQNELIERQKAELYELEENLRQLKKKLEDIEAAGVDIKTLSDKAKRYDEMSREYGSAILEARSEANNIISDAHMEADLIKNDAVEAVRDIKETAHRQIEATLEGTDNSFKTMIVNFVEEYTNYANKIHRDLDNIITGAKSRVDDIAYTIPSDLGIREEDSGTVFEAEFSSTPGGNGDRK